LRLSSTRSFKRLEIQLQSDARKFQETTADEESRILDFLETLYQGEKACYSIKLTRNLLCLFESHFDHLIAKYGLKDVDFQYDFLETAEKEKIWSIDRLETR
jgi:hypothetical protein